MVGTWECRDLHAMAQLSQFKSHTLIIRADGTYNEFLTSPDGTRGRPDAGRYTIEGNRVQFGGYGQWYTFSIAGKALTLTLEKSSNPDALGKSLTYHRLD